LRPDCEAVAQSVEGAAPVVATEAPPASARDVWHAELAAKLSDEVALVHELAKILDLYACFIPSGHTARFTKEPDS